MVPSPTRFWPSGYWIPVEPAFLSRTPSSQNKNPSGAFMAPAKGTLFLLSRWLPKNQGAVRVKGQVFVGPGLFSLLVEPKDGLLSIEWHLSGPIDMAQGSGFDETFQAAAWFVP